MKRMMIGNRRGVAAELPFRNNPPINNGELISAGAAATSNVAGAAASWGPISYPSPAAQVEDPGAEPVMRSTSLSFSVFPSLMPGTGNSIPLRTRRAGCHWLRTHVWLCVMFFPGTWKCHDCHLWILCNVGSRQNDVSCFLATYELDAQTCGLMWIMGSSDREPEIEVNWFKSS